MSLSFRVGGSILFFAAILPTTMLRADYVATDMGTFGGLNSHAQGISSDGRVCGNADEAGGADCRAFVYENGKLSELGTKGVQGSASQTNKLRQVVGTMNLKPYDQMAVHGFLFDNGTLTDLGTLGGQASNATSINDSGQIVGSATTSELEGNVEVKHAFMYEKGKMTDLGTLGGKNSYAVAINKSAIIVGTSETPKKGERHAFLFNNGKMSDMGTLGGIASDATGINDAGEIVGSSYITGGGIHAFLYSKGRMKDIGTLGGTFSAACGINNMGNIVGASFTKDSADYRAFLCVKGKMIDLNKITTLQGWKLTQAYSINDKDQIVCLGENSSSTQRAFLLTPKP